jgi:hypothetical protein
MTQHELKEMISDIIKSEFKRYVPLLIKEIRSQNKPVITESKKNSKPSLAELNTGEVNLSSVDWLKSMVGTEPIPYDTPNIDINANQIIGEAVERDYSELVKKMNQRPVR